MTTIRLGFDSGLLLLQSLLYLKYGDVCNNTSMTVLQESCFNNLQIEGNYADIARI